jgi:hypothetical protein
MRRKWKKREKREEREHGAGMALLLTIERDWKRTHRRVFNDKGKKNVTTLAVRGKSKEEKMG